MFVALPKIPATSFTVRSGSKPLGPDSSSHCQRSLTGRVTAPSGGITSAILDGFDEEIVRIAHDEELELEEVVGRVVDGEEVDISGLDKKEADYVKTTKLLLGHSLYSHSWLEL